MDMRDIEVTGIDDSEFEAKLPSVIVKDSGLIKIEDELSIVLKTANELVVNNPESQAQATDTIKFLGSIAKKMDEHRKKQVKPYADAASNYKKDVDKVISIADQAKKSLTDKAGIYAREQIRLEQERKRKEDERLLKEQQAEAERTILNAAVLHNNDDLADQAIMVNESFERQIEENAQKHVDVKFASRGNLATGFMQDNFSGKVLCQKTALQYILDTGRFELIEFKDSKIKELAKVKLKGKQENVYVKHGFHLVNNPEYRTR